MRRTAVYVFVCLTLFALTIQGALAKENKEALEQYNKALEIVKSADEELSSGGDDTAYCLYEEAISMLNGIKNRYTKWNKEKVDKQIKNALSKQGKLEASACAKLKALEEGRFRFLIWQRQRLILRKLDGVMNKLTEIKKEQEENQDIIKDIERRITS